VTWSRQGASHSLLHVCCSPWFWLIASIGFSVYVETFGNYAKTYGSLAAVVVLMLWLWLTAYAVLLGAEINAEAEQQTARDTTRGEPRPLGERNAVKADSIPQ
jgi:membrane protein